MVCRDAKFGYADGHDQNAEGTPYSDLRFGEPLTASPSVIRERRPGLLVNPETAQTWKDLETELAAQTGQSKLDDDGVTSDPTDIPEGQPGTTPTPPPSATTKHIVVNKVVEGDIDLNDISLLREEIIRSMSDGGGEITVSVTVSARNSEGFSENTVRSIRENSVQLGLNFEHTVD